MERVAMIKSLNGTDKCTIVSMEDNNHVVALYKGILCRAIFNPFVGLFYVDDVYGIIREDGEKE